MTHSLYSTEELLLHQLQIQNERIAALEERTAGRYEKLREAVEHELWKTRRRRRAIPPQLRALELVVARLDGEQ